ncbi:hypothetical protein [Mastigocladopsis repens]|uniref:hypothetical protein n=1 Tax=Mastigocladopsis repens TaxID=221287 RepID=UPI001E32A3A4|nr:hypothetical protein [Mastigocladopsis repens]
MGSDLAIAQSGIGGGGVGDLNFCGVDVPTTWTVGSGDGTGDGLNFCGVDNLAAIRTAGSGEGAVAKSNRCRADDFTNCSASYLVMKAATNRPRMVSLTVT